MSPESKSHLINRIAGYQEFCRDPNTVAFNDQELISRLSLENQTLLSPVRDKLKIYNACLHSVHRWQGHPYSQDFNHIGDTDYEHVIGILDICHQLKDQDLKGLDFNSIELMILSHDGGEIITDDVSLVHSEKDHNHGEEMKKVESTMFFRCILSQIRDQKEIHQLINSIYSRYEDRQIHPEDCESHLVKLIDCLQGDNYGLTHLYDSKKIESIYVDKVAPINPYRAIGESLARESCLLQKVLESSIDPNNSKIVTSYVANWQKTHFSDPNSSYHQEYLLCGVHNSILF